MHQCNFHLKNFYKICSWELLRKSAEELHICLKPQQNRNKFACIPNYVCIVGSVEYFVTLQQCKRKPLLCFLAKYQDLLLLTDTSRSTIIRRKVSLLFHGNNGSTNASQCYILRELLSFLLFWHRDWRGLACR